MIVLSFACGLLCGVIGAMLGLHLYGRRQLRMHYEAERAQQVQAKKIWDAFLEASTLAPVQREQRGRDVN